MLFPHLQPFSATEPVKLLSFLYGFTYAFDNLSIHKDAAVRTFARFPYECSAHVLLQKVGIRISQLGTNIIST